MKTLTTFVATTLFAVVMVVPAFAQQPATPDPHHPGAAPTPPASAPAAPSASAPMKHDGMPMMDMCRQMMGGGMAMPMMGGHGAMDPKAHAQMLEMRGEMMKAMGEVMMKHGRRMHGMKPAK